MNETVFLEDGDSAVFASDDPRPHCVDLVWSRDGSGAPGPGSGGDLCVVRRDLLSRQLLARTGDGRRLLVEVPLDEIDVDACPAVWGAVRSPLIDEILRNRAVASTSGGRSPVSFGYDAHPPLLLCTEKGVLFHPPWPGEGAPGPLRVCEDRDTLAAAGLPLYEASTRRYLVNPQAARVGTGGMLYTAARDRTAEGRGRVRSRDEFVLDLGARVAAGSRAPGTAPSFPCIGCDQAAQCHPAHGAAASGRPALAPQRIDVVAFYPFRVVARPLDVLTFGEHADLLGGATWRPFRTRHVRNWREPGMARAREDLARTAFADVGRTAPLAAFAAKLTLFRSVVEAVRHFHRDFGQPHLALDVDTVVSLSVGPDALGAYAVDLQGELRCAPLRDDRNPPPGATVWLPPPGPAGPFAAPDLVAAAQSAQERARAGTQHGFAYGVALPVRVTVGRIWGGPAPTPTEFELELAGQGLPETPFDPGDLVRVVVKGRGWENVVVWCRPDGNRATMSGCHPFRAHAIALDDGQTRDLAAAAARGALFADATVHRTYGAWYDLHALGMLLLRALLDNAGRELRDIVRDVLPALLSVTRRPEVAAAFDPWSELVRSVAGVVATPPLDRFLASGNVCFFGGEDVAPEDEVPPELWAEALALAVAAVSRGESTSFCAHDRLDRDRGEFCAPIDALLMRVGSLVERLPDTAAAPPVLEVLPLPDDDFGQPDPRDDEIVDLRREVRRLQEALTAQAATVARLESEREDVGRLRAEARNATSGNAASGAALRSWNALLTEIARTPTEGLAVPAPGEPLFELVRAIAADGLESTSALLTAAAELGGHEFALQHASLSRQVRRALAAGDDETVRAATRDLARARHRLGGLIAALVDAHATSTREGARLTLSTLDVGMRRELGLGRKEQAKLEKLILRMKDRVGELCVKLYDPVFQREVRKYVRDAAGGGGHTT